jgi:hypothetical protein
MVQAELFDSARRIRSRVDALLAIAEKMHYDIQLVGGCCEPGYDDKPVAIGNWNSRTEYHSCAREFKTLDETMPRLAKLFEKLGYECEWEDEWVVCDECGKAMRTEPDSYSWKPYYWTEGCSYICGDCTKDSPSDYLEHLSGNSNVALAFDIDLEKHGYALHSKDFESGFHEGQDADPKALAKTLVANGVTDFIFVLDDVSQFCVSFSVWIKPQEEED